MIEYTNLCIRMGNTAAAQRRDSDIGSYIKLRFKADDRPLFYAKKHPCKGDRYPHDWRDVRKKSHKANIATRGRAFFARPNAKQKERQRSKNKKVMIIQTLISQRKTCLNVQECPEFAQAGKSSR